MSDTKKKRRIKKRVAVTTPKSDKKPIATLTVTDHISFQPKPTEDARYTPYALPEGRSIRIGYRIVNKDGSTGEEGQIAYPATEGFYELALAHADYDAIQSVLVWAIPYGHAAVHNGVGLDSDFALGRFTYSIPPIKTTPETGILNIRLLDSVIGFIVGEMNRNKTSDVITSCRALNEEAADLEAKAAAIRSVVGPLDPVSISLEVAAKAARGAALAKFYWVERTEGVWDHKVPIGKVWAPVNRLGDSEKAYFYDIWSNIHFGYVGRAAGFSLRTLYIGSDIQNFIDHFRGDENEDKGSAKEGFDLYRAGRDVTIADILSILDRNPDWEWSKRKPK